MLITIEGVSTYIKYSLKNMNSKYNYINYGIINVYFVNNNNISISTLM